MSLTQTVLDRDPLFDVSKEVLRSIRIYHVLSKKYVSDIPHCKFLAKRPLLGFQC